MSSPTEQVSAADPASGLFQVDAFVRFTPAVHRVVRPAAELQLKVFRLLSEDAKDLSYFQVTGRLGALLGGALPRVLLAYRPELVVLDRDYGYDRGPIVFYEAHRGEVEVEVAPWLIAFAGGGRRIFSDMARSRYEVDLGLGGQIPLPVSFLNVLWAASGRMFRAHEPAYHQWGASALLAVQFRLPAGFLARLSGGVTVDVYPDSAGFRVFFPQGGSGHRRDVQGRFGATLWSPALWGVRLGASYEFSERDSTADPFGFRDHRGLVRLAWSGEVDVTLPRTAATAAPLALPWGFDAAGAGFDDRVQDMLRQDEQVQRSSSCVQ